MLNHNYRKTAKTATPAQLQKKLLPVVAPTYNEALNVPVLDFKQIMEIA